MAADNGVDIYGNIQVVYVNQEVGDNSTNNVQDTGSTIGFKHSHMISEGVTAFAKAEFEFDADEDISGIDQSDEIYVGVKGDFGSIQYGVDDGIVEWTDVVDISEETGLEGELGRYNIDEDTGTGFETLTYISPEIADGVNVAVELPAQSQSAFAGALAAKYAADNLEIAMTYAMGRDDGDGEPEDVIALSASYVMDDLTIAGQFETQSDTQDFIGLIGTYTMGQNSFSLAYGMSSFDADLEDETTIALQAIHNVSDNMYLFVEYSTVADQIQTDDDGAFLGQADADTLALGAIYSF